MRKKKDCWSDSSVMLLNSNTQLSWKYLNIFLLFFLTCHIGATVTIQIQMVKIAPIEARAFMGLTACLTGLVIAGATLSVFFLGVLFAWVCLALIGVKLEASLFVRPGCWLMAAACSYELIRCGLGLTILPKVMPSSPFKDIDSFIAWIDNLPLTSWGWAQEIIDWIFLGLMPLFFGIGMFGLLRSRHLENWFELVAAVSAFALVIGLYRFIGLLRG